jgi:hypothetical protein
VNLLVFWSGRATGLIMLISSSDPAMEAVGCLPMEVASPRGQTLEVMVDQVMVELVWVKQYLLGAAVVLPVAGTQCDRICRFWY